MNYKLLPMMFFIFLIMSGNVFSASGTVMITSPVDGATVSSGDRVKLSYEVVPGPEGDHLHLIIDDKRVGPLRQLKGTAEIDSLAPGKHQICITVNNKGHIPIGIEGCVNVTSK